MSIKTFLMPYRTEIPRCIWLLVGLVRSLKSSHKDALKETLLCEYYSDLTRPTSNKIPDTGNDHTSGTPGFTSFARSFQLYWVLTGLIFIFYSCCLFIDL